MLFKSSAILALGASAVMASPYKQQAKRQDTTTAADSTTTVTSMDSAASSTEMMSSAATTTVTDTAGSGSAASTTAMSSDAPTAMSSNASTASAAMTSSANASTEAMDFGCPDGYSLTYVIGSSMYPDVELMAAEMTLSNWTGAVPPPAVLTNSSGDGVGAMRMYNLTNVTFSETLTNQTDLDNGGLAQTWNLTMPLNISDAAVVIANATSDLTLFSNTTTNDTSVQLYVNFCASDQAAGLAVYAQLVTAYLTGLNELFAETSSNSTSANMTSSAAASSSAVMSSSAEMSSTAAAASDSATSAASSAVSGASSAASVAESSASSVASGGANSATSAIADATSAAASAVSSLIPTGTAA